MYHTIKNSELFALQEEAECKAKYEMVKNGIIKGYDNQIIADIIGLAIERIEELRKEVKN